MLKQAGCNQKQRDLLAGRGHFCICCELFGVAQVLFTPGVGGMGVWLLGIPKGDSSQLWVFCFCLHFSKAALAPKFVWRCGPLKALHAVPPTLASLSHLGCASEVQAQLALVRSAVVDS